METTEGTTDTTGSPDPEEADKSAKIAGLKAQIAELEGKDDTPTKPRLETNNKFGVNTRDGGIIVGNNLAMINGVSPTDAINLAAWLCIVANRNGDTDQNGETFLAIVKANPDT